eukprot:2602511-Amphidinium_carterae.1
MVMRTQSCAHIDILPEPNVCDVTRKGQFCGLCAGFNTVSKGLQSVTLSLTQQLVCGDCLVLIGSMIQSVLPHLDMWLCTPLMPKFGAREGWTRWASEPMPRCGTICLSLAGA